MAIRGLIKNIIISPVALKDVDPEETFVPAHMDLRNGYLSDMKNWIKRPGFNSVIDIGVDEPIDLLVPIDNGYVVTENGKVYKEATTTPVQLTGKSLNGTNRPTWAFHNGICVICDGGNPVKVTTNTARLGGNPPSGKFVDLIDSYLVISGQDNYTFKWCTAGNIESWPVANFNAVIKDGSPIVMNKVLNRELYFFKKNSIEIWVNIGGLQVFARRAIIDVVDKQRAGRGISGYSVVKANNNFYFYADGDFVTLQGNGLQVISNYYRSEIDKILNPDEIFGFDCRKESCVRWFAPIEGKCFKYDYANNIFSEDNMWRHGQFERLPWNSYMELNGKQYFGDYRLTGNIYEWSKDYKDDDGEPIRVYRKLRYALGDGNLSRVNRIRFRVKRGMEGTVPTEPKMVVNWKMDK